MTVKFRRSILLLAEDNPDDVEITRRALKRVQLSCDLIVTRDGQEALQRLLCEDEAPPDLALLDINLPKVSGLQVLAQIRCQRRLAGLPVVMMSASAREEDVLQSYELGANTYIQKPVAFEQFLTALEIFGRYWFEVARLVRPL
jgi:two-component system response regulator